MNTMKFLMLALFALRSLHAEAGSTEEKARRAMQKGMQQSGVGTQAVNNIDSTVAKAQADVNNNANTSKNSLQMGTLLNYAAAGAFISACYASEPNNYTLCAMGLMTAAQAASDQQQAGQSGGISDLTGFNPSTTPTLPTDPYKPTGTGNGTNTVTDLNTGKPTGGFTSKDLDDARNTLANAGFKVTDEGMTTPNGKFVSAADMGSSSALSAAGISPSAIDEAQKVLAAVSDEMSKYASGNGAKVAGVGVDSSGGGGGYSSEGGAGSEGGGTGGMGAGLFGSKKMPFAMDANQKRALVAGKTVMFDGDPIGVRGLNIFDMMHIAYQKKREVFIDLESGIIRPVASLRTPASVTKPMGKKSLTKAVKSK